LIVEVLSRTNRKKEIERKLREFFAKGCPLAWVIDPRTKTARAYTAPDRFEEFTARGTLDASPVLPGFKLSLSDVFGKLNRRKKA
jgi:Uma2 family endonuclease